MHENHCHLSVSIILEGLHGVLSHGLWSGGSSVFRLCISRHGVPVNIHNPLRKKCTLCFFDILPAHGSPWESEDMGVKPLSKKSANLRPCFLILFYNPVRPCGSSRIKISVVMAVAVHRNAVPLLNIPCHKLRRSIFLHRIPQEEKGSRNITSFQDIQHLLCVFMRTVIKGQKCQVLFTFKGFLPTHPGFHICCVIGIGGSLIGMVGTFFESLEVLHFWYSFFRWDLFSRSFGREPLHFREFFDFGGFSWICRFWFRRLYKRILHFINHRQKCVF